MSYYSPNKISTAILVASSVCLTLVAAAEAVPTTFSRTVAAVNRPTGPGTGTISSTWSAASSEFLLGVPANNFKGPFTGYAGINLPQLGSGLAGFAASGLSNPCDGNGMGTFTDLEVFYNSPASADPGLKVMLQDSAAGHYHLSTAAAKSIHTTHFIYIASNTDFSPALGTGEGPYFANINKAAILFYGGSAPSSNSIRVFSMAFFSPGKDYEGFGSGCAGTGSGNSGFSFIPNTTHTDAHFNYEFNTFNNISK